LNIADIKANSKSNKNMNNIRKGIISLKLKVHRLGVHFWVGGLLGTRIHIRQFNFMNLRFVLQKEQLENQSESFFDRWIFFLGISSEAITVDIQCTMDISIKHSSQGLILMFALSLLNGDKCITLKMKKLFFRDRLKFTYHLLFFFLLP
jgi:hypothetical protein